MKKLRVCYLVLSFIFACGSSYATTAVFSESVSKDCLRTIKRMELKEGIPNGLLHSISLVETNIGQTGKYYPWPYTIRLDRYKGKVITDIDLAFEELDLLVDLGFKNFDLLLNGQKYYSLSSSNLEDILNTATDAETIHISARSTIKYLKNQQEAKKVITNLEYHNWTNFKVGVMQLSYNSLKTELNDVSEALNPYTNTGIMINQLKKIRRQHTWWEAVGKYHSKQKTKAKRYVKNVWSMYQRVHKIRVR
ncbi:MAG: hypothetical protein CFH44_00082 [Proteobacteria bacterium]|nr:MAG: hypothetical protein CFH44_00082 [Pseudomonadota bacterium]